MALSTDPQWAVQADRATARRAYANGPIPPFTRRHFRLVADAIRTTQVYRGERIDIAGFMAGVFAAHNPRFARARFYREAGIVLGEGS